MEASQIEDFSCPHGNGRHLLSFFALFPFIQTFLYSFSLSSLQAFSFTLLILPLTFDDSKYDLFT